MTSTTANEPRPTRGAPVWPVVLIVAGALLLLGNVGWLSWHVLFSLELLFPPLLVAFGLDMLLQGRHRLLIVVGAIVAFAALSAGAGARLGTSGPAPEPMEVTQSLEGARRAVVALSSGVTDLTVRGDARSSLLVAGTVRPLRGERVQRSFDVAGGVARFALHSEGGFARWLGRAGRPGGWDLTLGGGVPVALTVDTGVGAADLDLSQAELERLDLDTGVGDTRVVLPARGRYAVDIDTGVGAVTVSVPRGLAARIEVSRGVGGVSVPSRFVPSGDDVYVSPDYATARHRVDLRIDSGVGAVRIVDDD